MKDKIVSALLRKKSVSNIVSRMDKNGGISTLAPIVQIAKFLINKDFDSKPSINILLPTPNSLMAIDRFKWFGMLPLFLEREVNVNLYVTGSDDLKPVTSPYNGNLSLVPAVNVHPCLSTPSDVEFDLTVVCHVNNSEMLVREVLGANSPLTLLLFWSETDWAVNAEVFKAFGATLSEPVFNEHSIQSSAEQGSGWCQSVSHVESIDHSTEVNQSDLITAKWLTAMHEHSSNLGHSNPYVMPGSGIKDLQLNKVKTQDYIYVIDNLILNKKNGFLYEYRQRNVSLVCALHEFNSQPSKEDTFLDKLIWAYTIKCLFYLRKNEKDLVNDMVGKAIREYSMVKQGLTGLLFKALVSEMDSRLETALDLYQEAAKEAPIDSYYRIGSILNAMGVNHKAIEAWEVSSKLGSAFAGYNAYAASLEHGYPSHSPYDHYNLLKMSAQKGFEPAQAALGELCYGLDKKQESAEWLAESAKNNNPDSAHNHVLILEELHANGLATKFEIKQAKKTLSALEKNIRMQSVENKG